MTKILMFTVIFIVCLVVTITCVYGFSENISKNHHTMMVYSTDTYLVFLHLSMSLLALSVAPFTWLSTDIKPFSKYYYLY